MATQQKLSDQEVERLWRMVLAIITQRAGLNLNYVLQLKPFVGTERNILMNQANGCKHLAIYLMRTQFDVSLRQLTRVAGIRYQRISQISSSVEDCRDNPDYEIWISEIEDVVKAAHPVNASHAA